MTSDIDNLGKFHRTGEYLYLTLPKRKTPLLIGKIIQSQRTFNIKRDRARHLLVKANAYGFNYHVLAHATLFDKVFLVDDRGRYMIPVKDILDKGSFLWFKTEGYERQIFLTLDQLKPYLVYGHQ